MNIDKNGMDKLLHCIYKYPDRQFKTALDNKEKFAMSYHLTTETHSGKLLSPIPRFGQYKTGSKLFLDILVQGKCMQHYNTTIIIKICMHKLNALLAICQQPNTSGPGDGLLSDKDIFRAPYEEL